MYNVFMFAVVRSRSVSPTHISGIDRLQTPTRRSRRLSERSNTPTREIPDEPMNIEESRKHSRGKSSTPNKSGRTSPALGTPRRTRRTSGGSIHDASNITIMEPLVEDDEERNTEEEPKPEPAVKKSSTKVKTRPISNKRRATRSRVSEISLLENITEDTGEEVGASKEPESTLHMPELPLSSPKTFSQEDQRYRIYF